MTNSLALSRAGGSEYLRGIDLELIQEILFSRRLQSPALLLSRPEIRRNLRDLQAALPRAAVHYATKANNDPTILDELHQSGGKFEICSAREIDAVTAAGASIHELIHSHPVKSIREFDAAVEKGVRLFVVDNPEEVKKLNRYADTKLRLLVRFRVESAERAVVDLQYKFGCAVDEVLPLARMIRDTGHDYAGLCFHTGSQCLYPDNYVKGIEAGSGLIKALEDEGLSTEILDIGGGFPVSYLEPVAAIDEFCRPINTALERHLRPEIKIVCEPGRFISASPVTLVCSIIGKSVRNGRIWYYLDDGLYSTFSGILYDHCRYPVLTEREGEAKLSVLAGPTCDSFDVMYDGLLIPEHEVGDLLIFPLTGAYCDVSGSDFNSLERPRYEVLF